ncbi:MAG TPA: ABC transporter substrate-binding protein [Stellaceae bacterium]|nr:ABC transporter substrate-binding protein [Stellaceae bacterium]
MSTFATTRRKFLIGTSALATAGLGAPAILRAQGAPIRLGTLTPLTGAGGPYGPVMVTCAKATIEQINKAGGVLGQQLLLTSEDDQTNPEAGVAAARKLIDIDKVIAIMGTWASTVTTAVAPLCWESKTFLTTTSGADSITLLPHQGYLIRTQPNTTLQGRKFGEFALELGAKRIFVMAPQTPFTQSQFQSMKAVVDKAGGSIELLVYDDKKPTLRTEVDQAIRFKPDLIVAGGYTPDTSVLLKDLFRADFKGKVLGFGYAINQKLLEALPPDVSNGAYALSPSPAAGSGGYQKVAEMVKTTAPDPYTCQIYDHVNLITLAVAKAKQASGTAIRETIHQVSETGGEKVDNAVDGLRLIAAGKPIDYQGASGPCRFTPEGDITNASFRYEKVVDGKLTLVKIA